MTFLVIFSTFGYVKAGVMRPSPNKSELARRKYVAAKVAFSDPPSASPQKPEPEQFGLSADFDLVNFASFMKTREHQNFIIKAIVFVGFAVALYFLIRERIEQGEAWVGYVLPIAFSYMLVFMLPLSEYALKAYFGDATFIESAQDFGVALKEWTHFNTVTGVGYWRALRGTELEWAAAKLFRDREWAATTTSATRDGGVDLILKVGHREFHCQCKGHAKPVSVAAVREIAGVCAESNAIPMLIVVNGVTGPALAEARKLSVIVLDSTDLAAFAHGKLELR